MSLDLISILINRSWLRPNKAKMAKSRVEMAVMASNVSLAVESIIIVWLI